MTRENTAESYPLYDTPEDLSAYLDRVSPSFANGRRPRASLDLEADSFHNYREKICLVQINVEGAIALFDPLGAVDLKPLLTRLEKSELWFHGGDYDLSLLKKTYDWTPAEYFDTQIAARLCGLRQFGLAALAKHYLDHDMPKSGQRADWSRRPLTPDLLKYGAEDVRCTLELADILLRALEGNARMPWFTESCATALHTAKNRTEKSREDAWRLQGSGKFSPRELTILRAAWHWRDKEAERRDRPHFKVVNNEALLSYVDRCHRQGALDQVPKGVRGDSAAALKAQIKAALELPEEEWPTNKIERRRRIRPEEKDLDFLRAARDKVAGELDIENSLIATRITLEELVLDPSKADQLLQHWQRELLAEPLATLNHKRL